MAGMAPADVNADLLHLFAQSKVSDEVQKTFFDAEVKSVKSFAAMFSGEDDLRAVLKKDFAMDPDSGGLKMRVAISKVVIAWETAKGRAGKVAELEAEAEQRSEAKRLPVPEHKAMKESFENKFWELTERHVPAPRWMEKRFDQIEKNTLRAEPLSEVLAVCEEDDTLAVPRVDKSGGLVTVKVGNRIPLPENTETLRARLDLWGRSWIFAASMHTNRKELKDLDPMDFTHYVNYLLGDHVMGLLTDGPPGTPVVGEMWVKLLDYELEMRKEMMTRMEKGTSLKQALKDVRADPEVKMKYLTDPVQFKLRKKRTHAEATGGATYDDDQPTKVPKGNPKGKGKYGKRNPKGKGKGKNSRPDGKCKFKTDAGKQICFKFNNRGEWCPGSCGRAHVCGICFRPNTPMFNCDYQPRAAAPPG